MASDRPGMDRSFKNLRGKRVLVTCSAAVARDLVLSLNQAGASIIHIPLIETAPPSDNFLSLDAAIGEIHSFSWLLFTSRNGVLGFLARLKSRSIPAGVKIAAIGPGTASELACHGLSADVVAEMHDAEGLLEALRPVVQRGEHVLWPRSRDARDVLAKGLGEIGAVVIEAETYRTVTPEDLDCARLLRIVNGGEVEAILFDSPSAFKNFVEVVGESRARILSKKILFIPIGPVTGKAIESII